MKSPSIVHPAISDQNTDDESRSPPDCREHGGAWLEASAKQKTATESKFLHPAPKFPQATPAPPAPTEWPIGPLRVSAASLFKLSSEDLKQWVTGACVTACRQGRYCQARGPPLNASASEKNVNGTSRTWCSRQQPDQRLAPRSKTTVGGGGKRNLASNNVRLEAGENEKNHSEKNQGNRSVANHFFSSSSLHTTLGEHVSFAKRQIPPILPFCLHSSAAPLFRRCCPPSFFSVATPHQGPLALSPLHP